MLCAGEDVAFLKVDTTSLTFRGNEIFLSGANQPWIQYGDDFGNNQSNGIHCELQQYIHNVSKAGGNSIRIWLFVEGTNIPAFDTSGHCIGTDGTNTLSRDLQQYARYAASQNVFINICLWNGAVLKASDHVRELVEDETKLQSFIDKALTPLVTALKDEPAIGAWEIMNEPEGSVKIDSDDEPCFDTGILKGSGAGWSGAGLAMKDLLKFHNLQASAIHKADPKALVTVGSWSQYSSTDASLGKDVDPGRKFFNYYKDECLVKAGGQAGGTLDFYQIHTYPNNGKFSPSSPFEISADKFLLDKPVVIGEFACSHCTEPNCDAQTLYKRGANTNYSGVWDWSLLGGDNTDDEQIAVEGMKAIENDPRVIADISSGSTPPIDTCSCSDTPPDSQYTCEQQASWGKCDQAFMKGFCCRSCHACQGCS
jgi:mannan endo-1,4-beta-mannosidase